MVCTFEVNQPQQWECPHVHHLAGAIPYYTTLKNRSCGLLQKSYKLTNQIAAFAILAWWLSEYSPCIANDVDVMFKNGCLCWQNVVKVNGFNLLNS